MVDISKKDLVDFTTRVSVGTKQVSGVFKTPSDIKCVNLK